VLRGPQDERKRKHAERKQFELNGGIRNTRLA
jgi:hypothetical protein